MSFALCVRESQNLQNKVTEIKKQLHTRNFQNITCKDFTFRQSTSEL